MKMPFRFEVVAGAILIVIAGLFLRQVEGNTRRTEAWIVPPTVDEESVSEVGYVRRLKSEISFLEHKREIMWWVKVPETNRTYACSWRSGYSGFRQGDGVRIIHKRVGIDAPDHSGRPAVCRYRKESPPSS